MCVCGLVEGVEPTRSQEKHTNAIQKKLWHKGDLNPDPFRCEGTGPTTEPLLVSLKRYFFLSSHSSTTTPPRLLKVSVNTPFLGCMRSANWWRQLVEAGKEKERDREKERGRGDFFTV